MSTFYLFLFQYLFFLHTLSNALIKSPFFLLSIILILKGLNCGGREIKTRCTRMSLDNSNFSVLSRVTRLDISIMYFLMFPLPLNRIETSLEKIVLVSTFSYPTNQSIIWLRKLLAFSSSGITPLMVFGIECFMIIRLMRLECSHYSKLALCFAVLSLVKEGGCSVWIA